jgi:hypothetical protein
MRLGERDSEMIFRENVVRGNVTRGNEFTGNCAFGKMIRGEMKYGETLIRGIVRFPYFQSLKSACGIAGCTHWVNCQILFCCSAANNFFKLLISKPYLNKVPYLIIY